MWERPTKILIVCRCDRCCTLAQTYNNFAETHLSGGVLSPFVFPLIAIARCADCRCDIMYVAIRALDHNDDVAKHCSMCEQLRTISCVKASDTACD